MVFFLPTIWASGVHHIFKSQVKSGVIGVKVINSESCDSSPHVRHFSIHRLTSSTLYESICISPLIHPDVSFIRP